jgi:cellulose synthase/poly-beta-1,6-N-acetylglucosamine synthase-like glycosyltransferase
MNNAVCVPVRNEIQNLPHLLYELLHQAPDLPIYVISTDSDDGTDELVDKTILCSNNIHLVQLPIKGKNQAINYALGLLGYDWLTFIDGDMIPTNFKQLIELNPEQPISLIAPKLEPIEPDTTLYGFISHLMWNLFNELCKKTVKLPGSFKLRTQIIKEVPNEIINGDFYIQVLTELKGYKTMYYPNSEIMLRGANNFKDFWNQRERTWIGHFQILSMNGGIKSISKLDGLKVWRKCLPYRNFKGYVYGLVFLALMGLSYLTAYFKFYLGKWSPLWEPADSTKKLY